MTEPFEIAADTQDLCGEAPLWMQERRSVIWFDQGRRLVRQLTPTGVQVLARGFAAGGAVLTDGGGVVLSGPDGLATLTADNRLINLPLAPLPQGGCLNDACAGPKGELFAGVMSLSANASGVERPGHLVRIDPDGKVQILDSDIVLPNGMGLSPDRQNLYVVDSVRRQVLSYSVDELERGQAARQVLVTLAAADGVPDGLAVDALGGIWLAMWYTGQLIRITSTGRIDAKLQLPFAQVSSLAFGGDDGCELYVTTAAFPWQSEFAPPVWSVNQLQGGALLRMRPGVKGSVSSNYNGTWK